MNTTVVNLRYTNYDIYIGRVRSINLVTKNQHFGNPFSHKHEVKDIIKVPSRDIAIKQFEKWLRGEDWYDVEPMRRQWILDNLHTLEGKRLGCFCKPYDCHGEVLVKLLNEQLCKKQ